MLYLFRNFLQYLEAIVPAPCLPASSPDSPVLSATPPESAAVIPPRGSGCLPMLSAILAQSRLRLRVVCQAFVLFLVALTVSLHPIVVLLFYS